MFFYEPQTSSSSLGTSHLAMMVAISFKIVTLFVNCVMSGPYIKESKDDWAVNGSIRADYFPQVTPE